MFVLLAKISMAVWCAIWLGVPGCILTGIIPKTRQMSRRAQFCISVIAVWVLLILYHFFIHDPILLKAAQSENLSDSAEVGGFIAKGALLFLGWIVGIQSTLIWVVCIYLYNKWKNKRR
jgi:hypothetical protein